MTDKNKLIEDLQHFEQLAAKDSALITKLNEFIILLQDSELNTENVRDIKNQVNKAFDKKLSGSDLIEEIKYVSLSSLDKMDQLSQLENLLINNHLDSKQVKKINYRSAAVKVVKVIIGLLFVTLGFSMIIMPAPPYFEMFTIFYFTINDGVTLMDLISLIIVAVGIYIVLQTMINPTYNE